MLKRARIAVFVSGGGTNLEALLQAQERGDIPHGQIVLVCASNPNAYALTRAANHGVDAAAFPKKQMSQADFESALQEKLAEYHIDLIILAGFLSILSAEFTARWDGRILNVHPSLIPAFCGKGFYGLRVHEAALSRGVKVTGATVHLVNEIRTAAAFCCKKRWRFCPAIHRRPCSAGSWSRPNGCCCPGPPSF